MTWGHSSLESGYRTGRPTSYTNPSQIRMSPRRPWRRVSQPSFQSRPLSALTSTIGQPVWTLSPVGRQRPFSSPN